MQAMNSYSDEDEAFLRRLILLEEDWYLFTSAPWRGGYRWFRSPNVVPIEQWRGCTKNAGRLKVLCTYDTNQYSSFESGLSADLDLKF